MRFHSNQILCNTSEWSIAWIFSRNLSVPKTEHEDHHKRYSNNDRFEVEDYQRRRKDIYVNKYLNVPPMLVSKRRC
jgi:hypothetical protein